jgi:hypothetical protein
VQLARAGCTFQKSPASPATAPFSAEQILAKYLPRDNEVAWNAQRKRGLIGPKSNRSLTARLTASLTVVESGTRDAPKPEVSL